MVERCACTTMNAKIVSFLHNFCANLVHIPVRNGTADIGNARGRNRAFCGAPSHRSVSKGGHFFL